MDEKLRIELYRGAGYFMVEYFREFPESVMRENMDIRFFQAYICITLYGASVYAIPT